MVENTTPNTPDTDLAGRVIPQNHEWKFLLRNFLLGVLASGAVSTIIYVGIHLYKNSLDLENTYPQNNHAFDIGTTATEDFDTLIGQDPEAATEPDYSDIYDAIDQSKQHNAQTPPASPPPASTDTYWGYPATILPCTRSGDDLLVLVNKSYQLPADYYPTDLVAVTDSGLRVSRSGMYIRSIVIDDLAALRAAVATEGIDLTVLSAFRSYAVQSSTYTYWVNYNGGSIDAADKISARPGHSQHQLGTTLDFSTNEIADQLGQHFANTRAGVWLAAHAWEYGFALAYPQGWEAATGYSFEPWHFRYIGRENAARWHASGLILEVWLRGENGV